MEDAWILSTQTAQLVSVNKPFPSARVFVCVSGQVIREPAIVTAEKSLGKMAIKLSEIGLWDRFLSLAAISRIKSTKLFPCDNIRLVVKI